MVAEEKSTTSGDAQGGQHDEHVPVHVPRPRPPISQNVMEGSWFSVSARVLTMESMAWNRLETTIPPSISTVIDLPPKRLAIAYAINTATSPKTNAEA